MYSRKRIPPPVSHRPTVFGVVLPSDWHPTPPTASGPWHGHCVCLPSIHRPAQSPCQLCHLVLAIPLIFEDNSSTWRYVGSWCVTDKLCIDSVSMFLTKMVTTLCSKRDLYVQQETERQIRTVGAALRSSLHCLWRAGWTFNVAGQNGNTQRRLKETEECAEVAQHKT